MRDTPIKVSRLPEAVVAFLLIHHSKISFLATTYPLGFLYLCQILPKGMSFIPSCFWHISPMARNAKAYRAAGISSCVSNISKIPWGIYLDAWHANKNVTLARSRSYLRRVWWQSCAIRQNGWVLSHLAFGISRLWRVMQKHIECVSTYRTPQAYIENPARDLSRCVFSVKDNTLKALYPFAFFMFFARLPPPRVAFFEARWFFIYFADVR